MEENNIIPSNEEVKTAISGLSKKVLRALSKVSRLRDKAKRLNEVVGREITLGKTKYIVQRDGSYKRITEKPESKKSRARNRRNEKRSASDITK